MDNKIRELESKSELKEKLSSLQRPHLFVENSSEEPNRFLLIETQGITVGLVTYYRSIKAQIATMSRSNALLIGHDKELLCCSPVGPNISWRVELDFCFHEFKLFEEMETIVIIDEISVSAVNLSGERIWYQPSPDVIEWFEISDFETKIRTMDSQEMIFDTKTGSILSKK